MKRNAEYLRGKAALEVIEEAVHLLRRAPAPTLAVYYLGALPFVLGVLYFWADMGRDAFAYRHCPQAAFGVALLYLWMKCWHGLFARQLLAQVRSEPKTRWTFGRAARLVFLQSGVQPTGLFVLPFAAVLTLPFGYAYAFYHSISVLEAQPGEGLRATLRKAVEHSSRWPAQNHALIAVLFGFSFFVFLNLLIAAIAAPELLRMLLGVETVFTLSGLHLFNTTFLAAVGFLTYLCMNPLIKAVYVLRVFYGESVHSGEDLRVELRSLSREGRVAVASVLLALGLFGAQPAAADDAGDAAAPSSVSPTELDQAIREVLEQREYSWRMPREEEAGEKGIVVTFLESVVEWTRQFLKTLRGWAEKVMDWLRSLFERRTPGDRGGGLGWMTATQSMLFVLLAAVVCALVLLCWRMWKQRHRPRADVVAQAIASAPDLTDDNVVADQLPVESWLARAQELMQQGDLRLALRALYLASLAHLAQRELIRIAKFKSNREYEQELRRRAHVHPELLSAFSTNVSTFEQVWYGRYDVSHGLLDDFHANLQRMEIGASR